MEEDQTATSLTQTGAGNGSENHVKVKNNLAPPNAGHGLENGETATKNKTADTYGDTSMHSSMERKTFHDLQIVH